MSTRIHAYVTRRAALVGATLVVAAGLVSGIPSTASSSAPKTPTGAKSSLGEELRIGTTQEFENLNPLIANMSATTYILGAVNRTQLVILDEKNQWIPMAASRIPTLDNGGAVYVEAGGKRKLRVTWEVRADVVWGDGKPVTAADYRLAWDIGRSDKTSVPNREPFANVEAFETDPGNPKRFTVTLTEPKFHYFRNMWSALPAHLEAKVFKEWGAKPEGYDRNTNYAKSSADPGLYSGPYRVAAIKLGSHIELVPNEKWWGGEKPHFRKVVLRVIPNSGTLESNLVSGEIAMANGVGMTLDQAVAFEKRAAAEKQPFQVSYVDGLTYEHIDVNLNDPHLADVRVRKALLHAIDREALVKALFDGKQKVAHHSIHPTDPWFTDDAKVVTKYEFSPRKARRLLGEAGYKPGAGGVLEKEGKPLRVTFMTTAGNKSRENVQAFLKDQWAQVGVAVEIRNEPAKVFFGETTTKRKFGGLAMYAWTSAPEGNLRQILHSENIPSATNGWAGTNFMGWRNAAVDKAIDSLEAEFSLEKRKALAATVVREYTAELPVLPLYYRANVVVAAKALVGMTPTAHTYAETYHIERWRADTRLSAK
jgi:peptide/nickel transport system substrate-binding protein